MKKIAILIFIFLLIAVVVVCLIPVRPVVIVQNATKERVYLSAYESVYGIELTPEEVDKIMRGHPDVIEPGKTLKITASFTSLMTDGSEFNIGWSTGGRFEYNATGGGGKNFQLSSKSGMCSVKLIIHSGYNYFEIDNRAKGLCLKKISLIK